MNAEQVIATAIHEAECEAYTHEGRNARCERSARAAVAALTEAASLCSQCGELPSVMVKIGTTDGWCTECLDRAAATPDAGIKALVAAADEMSAVIADGDVAEVAAPVEGEVGRAACVERRDFLLEDPVDWLRAYTVQLGGPSDG